MVATASACSTSSDRTGTESPTSTFSRSAVASVITTASGSSSRGSAPAITSTRSRSRSQRPLGSPTTGRKASTSSCGNIHWRTSRAESSTTGSSVTRWASSRSWTTRVSSEARLVSRSRSRADPARRDAVPHASTATTTTATRSASNAMERTRARTWRRATYHPASICRPSITLISPAVSSRAGLAPPTTRPARRFEGCYYHGGRPKWSRLPGAWVRRVAVNLATSTLSSPTSSPSPCTEARLDPAPAVESPKRMSRSHPPASTILS